jgi:hypothetical protein
MPATVTDAARPEYPQEATATAVLEQRRRDAIAQRAYALFEERGREPGRDVDDWLRAEHEIEEARRQS